MEPNNTPTPAESKQSRTALIITLTIAVLAIAIVAAMLINGNLSAPSTTTQTETTTQETTDTSKAPDASSPAETATITFTKDGFSPSTLTVKKGTKITVVNKSSNPVQFSSADHPTHRENPELNMSQLAPGARGTITVTVVGTHGFHDHIDDSKTGTLVVTE